MKLIAILGEELYNKLLTGEQTNKPLSEVLTELDTAVDTATANLIDKSSGDYVPRSRIDEINKKHSDEMKDRTNELDKVMKKLENNSEAVAELEQLKESQKKKDEAHEAQRLEDRKRHAAEIALLKVTPHSELFLSKINLDKMELASDGGFHGLKDQIDELTKNEEYKGFFGKVKIHGDGKPSPGKPPEQRTGAEELQKQYSELTTGQNAVSPSDPRALALKRQIFDAQKAEAAAAAN